MTLLQESRSGGQTRKCTRVAAWAVRLSAYGERSRPRAGARGTTTRPCYGEIIRATIRKTTMTYKKDDYSATHA